MNDIAILIDCWETTYSKKKIEWSDDYIMFNSIKTFIETTPSINTIILASYQSYDKRTSVWYKNCEQLIGKELFRQKDLTIEVRPFVLWETAESLLNWESDRYQIAVHELWEFELLLEQRHVGDIYLCGQSLENCIRTRPLGYNALAQFIKDRKLTSRILIKDNCVNDSNGNIFNLDNNPDWIQTSEPGIFEYVIQ